jgi:hypothetical protein
VGVAEPFVRPADGSFFGTHSVLRMRLCLEKKELLEFGWVRGAKDLKESGSIIIFLLASSLSYSSESPQIDSDIFESCLVFTRTIYS